MDEESLREQRKEETKQARDQLYRTVSRRIREARTFAGLSQYALSQKSGIYQSAVSMMEYNKRHLIDILHIVRIANACNVSTDFILGVCDDPMRRDINEEFENESEND